MALQFVNPVLTGNREVVSVAVRQNGLALLWLLILFCTFFLMHFERCDLDELDELL